MTVAVLVVAFLVSSHIAWVLWNRNTLLELALEDWRRAFDKAADERMEAKNRYYELYEAIREHRDQHGDDRCWMDDQKLYAVLKDDNLGDNRTPPKEKMLQTCSRYIDSRCQPTADWKSYEELEDDNLRLRLGLKSIRHEADCNLKEKKQCDSQQPS